jgi:hypothetical protein
MIGMIVPFSAFFFSLQPPATRRRATVAIFKTFINSGMILLRKNTENQSTVNSRQSDHSDGRGFAMDPESLYQFCSLQ